MTHTEFATALQTWRRNVARLSQPQAAEYLGVGLSTYRQWEYGLHKPNHPEHVLRIIGYNEQTTQDT